MDIARRALVLAAGLAALGVASSRALAQQGLSLRDIYRMAEALEVQARKEKPDWAAPAAPPLFTFAWISDPHLSRGREDLVKQAFAYIDETLKPDFLVCTGDNNAVTPRAEARGQVQPASVRRQLYFKEFLEKNLKTPAVVVPGDNWPWDFEKVFGAFQFSFDYGGLHFLFATTDRSGPGTEGCAVFDEATWRWMEEDLTRNQDRPTIFLLHETIVPPTFLDALRARRLLETSPNVVACFCGHLHLDLEFQPTRVKYLVCPALGPGLRHGLKHVRVHPTAILLDTHEYDPASKRFRQVDKWQRIEIPAPLRAGLRKPAPGAGVKRNYSEVAPHPRTETPELNARVTELFAPLLLFLAEFGIKDLLLAPPEAE